MRGTIDLACIFFFTIIVTVQYYFGDGCRGVRGSKRRVVSIRVESREEYTYYYTKTIETFFVCLGGM